MQHFLSITDLNAEQITQLIHDAVALKKEWKESYTHTTKFPSYTMAMFFEKASLRTRLSFEIGMAQFGGHAIYLDQSMVGLGEREELKDVGAVTSSMCDIMIARTYKHESLVEMAKYSSVPLINALSDLEHPCQILADLQTIYEVKGRITDLKLAFVGDCDNNVTNSLVLACSMLGMSCSCAGPEGYLVSDFIINQAKSLNNNFMFEQSTDAIAAVKDADIVVTDTRVSMGSENEKAERITTLQPYQVSTELMSYAKDDAMFMHCLPAYRGKEVTPEVIDGSQSVVVQEAENRLHAQKALVAFLLK